MFESRQCNLAGFPGGSVVNNLPANAGDAGSNPRSGRSPGEGNGTPLQYSSLENPMDRGAWQATVCGVHKKVRHDLNKKHRSATRHSGSKSLLGERSEG